MMVARKQFAGVWTADHHDGITQSEGGEDSAATITNEAPLSVSTQTQQTQAQQPTTIRAQGGGDLVGAAQVTTPSRPSLDQNQPAPLTMSDSDTTSASAIVPILTNKPNDIGEGAAISPRPTTMSTSTTSSTKEELKGTIESDSKSETSSSTTPFFSPIATASPISTYVSMVSIFAVVPLPTSSTPARTGNGTTANIIPGSGKSARVNIAYAAIAPAVFVMLVLAAIFVRRRQRKRRVLRAEANPRSGGVLAEGGVPIIAVPIPPSRRGRGENGKGMEMQHFPSLSTTTTNPILTGGAWERTRENERERELRDSDIYSPRYGTPSNHTSASASTTHQHHQQNQTQNQTQRIGLLPSIPSIELEDLNGLPLLPQQSQRELQAPPPKLPPLPSPDLEGSWLPSCLNSPGPSPSPSSSPSPARNVQASPIETTTVTSSPSSAYSNPHSLSAEAPPVRGPAISSGNLVVATPFHKNYKRSSDAPTNTRMMTGTSSSRSLEGVKEVGGREKS